MSNPVDDEKLIELGKKIAPIVRNAVGALNHTRIGYTHEDDALADPFIDAILKEVAAWHSQGVGEADIQRRIDEDNLAMLTYLQDELGERMYENGKLVNGKWRCDTSVMAVDCMKIEDERRKLIKRLEGSEL